MYSARMRLIAERGFSRLVLYYFVLVIDLGAVVGLAALVIQGAKGGPAIIALFVTIIVFFLLVIFVGNPLDPPFLRVYAGSDGVRMWLRRPTGTVARAEDLSAAEIVQVDVRLVKDKYLKKNDDHDELYKDEEDDGVVVRSLPAAEGMARQLRDPRSLLCSPDRYTLQRMLIAATLVDGRVVRIFKPSIDLAEIRSMFKVRDTLRHVLGLSSRPQIMPSTVPRARAKGKAKGKAKGNAKGKAKGTGMPKRKAVPAARTKPAPRPAKLPSSSSSSPSSSASEQSSDDLAESSLPERWCSLSSTLQKIPPVTSRVMRR